MMLLVINLATVTEKRVYSSFLIQNESSASFSSTYKCRILNITSASEYMPSDCSPSTFPSWQRAKRNVGWKESLYIVNIILDCIVPRFQNLAFCKWHTFIKSDFEYLHFFFNINRQNSLYHASLKNGHDIRR